MTLIYRLPHNIFLSQQINQFSSADQFGSESFHIEMEFKGGLTGQNTCMVLISSALEEIAVLLEFPL